MTLVKNWYATKLPCGWLTEKQHQSPRQQLRAVDCWTGLAFKYLMTPVVRLSWSPLDMLDFNRRQVGFPDFGNQGSSSTSESTGLPSGISSGAVLQLQALNLSRPLAFLLLRAVQQPDLISNELSQKNNRSCERPKHLKKQNTSE